MEGFPETSQLWGQRVTADRGEGGNEGEELGRGSRGRAVTSSSARRDRAVGAKAAGLRRAPGAFRQEGGEVG